MPMPDGSSRRVKVRGRSQVDARERMAARVAKLTATTDSKVTVEAFVQAWLEHKEPSLRASTMRGYRQDVNLYIIPMLGPKPLARVAAWDVQSVIDSISRRGALVMADRVRRTLRQALGYAVAMGLTAVNAAEFVKPVKAPIIARKSWSLEQGLAFLRVAKTMGAPWPGFFLAALTTGLRKGELIALRRSDLTANRLRVQRAFSPYEPELYTAPKSRESLRAVPIAPWVSEVLRRQAGDGELLFPSWDGGPLNPRTVTTRFNEAIIEAGVPSIRFHDLRRTYTTWMLQSGTDVRTVQRLLGHSTPVLTLSVYADAANDGATVSLGGDLGVDSPVQERDESVRLGAVKRRRKRRKADQE